ncbi:MAG: D-alanine--D-alanine ligase [Phycisphaerae bacterium]|jgi:D-alanine-D-alanine ligase
MTAMQSSGPTSAAARRALRVTVLAGGPSAERAVSLDSGRAVAEALRRRGHAVRLADIGPDDLSALDHAADVVFPALHGPFGEDGQVQRILEQRGIRFVGSGSRASALAMDKVAAKKVAAELGVLTAEYEVVCAGQTPTLPVPVVVKPVDQGSSVGTAIVKDPGELPAAAAAVCVEFGRALVERFIQGDEVTVGVIDGVALPPICIRAKRGFYDYEAKYRDERTEYLFEAGLAPEVLARAAQQSLRLFVAMGCRHLGRVDWIVDADGRAWFLELNTIPGFTSHSLTPMAAARAGIPFDELVERLVYLAHEGAHG